MPIIERTPPRRPKFFDYLLIASSRYTGYVVSSGGMDSDPHGVLRIRNTGNFLVRLITFGYGRRVADVCYNTPFSRYEMIVVPEMWDSEIQLLTDLATQYEKQYKMTVRIS